MKGQNLIIVIIITITITITIIIIIIIIIIIKYIFQLNDASNYILYN